MHAEQIRAAVIGGIRSNRFFEGARELFSDSCYFHVTLSNKVDLQNLEEPEKVVGPAYTSSFCALPVPKYELSEIGMRPDCAYQLVHDEMNLDGNPALNQASFVTTWMEPCSDAIPCERCLTAQHAELYRKGTNKKMMSACKQTAISLRFP